MNERHPVIFVEWIDWIDEMARKMIGAYPGVDEDDFAQDVLVDCYIVCAYHEQTAITLNNPKGYFYRIARYKLIDLLKQAARTSNIYSLEAMSEAGWDVEETKLKSDPQYWIEADEIITCLEVMLTHASPKMRKVWRLYLEGAPHAEIAERLGISQVMSRQYIHRGRRRMNRDLDEEE